MQYVDRVVKILKDKRRIINLISHIKLVQNVGGIKDNYLQLKKYNLDAMTKFAKSMRMYFCYKNCFLK
jgi:hypothetical protein